MARDYQDRTRRHGVFVPRWLITGILFAPLVLITLRILRPPNWTVQRLDSPDGRYAAMLVRHRYLQDAFSVRVKEGWAWRTCFYSEPVSDDYRVDLQERLVWTEDSRRLLFLLEGVPVWAYDFHAGRQVDPRALGAETPSRFNE